MEHLSLTEDFLYLVKLGLKIKILFERVKILRVIAKEKLVTCKY